MAGNARTLTLAAVALLGLGLLALFQLGLFDSGTETDVDEGGALGPQPQSEADPPPTPSDLDGARAQVDESEGRSEVTSAPEPEQEGDPEVLPLAESRTASLRVNTPALVGQITKGPSTGERVQPEPGSPGVLVADELYPGLHKLRVIAGGGVMVERDVMLRARQEVELTISLGETETMHGQVVDGEGRGLAGARLLLDGARASSGADGRFQIERVPGEEQILHCELRGHATYRRALTPELRGSLDDPVVVHLRESGNLTILLGGQQGSPHPADVYLFPGSAVPRDGRPPRPVVAWPDLLPLRIAPGSGEALPDVPVGRYRVVALHPDLEYAPRDVWVQAGGYEELRLEASEGDAQDFLVTIDGRPCSEARARLIWEDANFATLRSLDSDARHARDLPIELHPAARLWTHAGADGRLSLGRTVAVEPAQVELMGPRGMWRRLSWEPPSSGPWTVAIDAEGE